MEVEKRRRASRSPGPTSSTHPAQPEKTASRFLRAASLQRRKRRTPRLNAGSRSKRNVELQNATPGEISGTLAGLLKEFFDQHGEKSLGAKTLKRYREMADYLDAAL